MPSPKTLVSTVAFTDPQNNPMSAGHLVLDLSTPAVITSGGGQIAPARVSILLDSNGLIPGATTIWANDQLTPSGTAYYARLLNDNDLLVADLGYWAIIGTTPIDLSQEVSTALSISYPNPVVTNPGATQAITGGFDLTLNGSNVVTRTTTDTLTNKTLTSPIITNPAISGTLTGSSLVQKGTAFTGASSGNNLTLLNFQGVLAPVVGTAADLTYYTFSLPANTMAAGKGIRITAYASHSTGTAAINWKMSFGGTLTTGAVAVAGVATAVSRFVYTVFNNAGVTNAQSLLTDAIVESAAGQSAVLAFSNTSSIATTSNVTINVTFNVAATDQITPRAFFVELIQ